jgi:hypothetical protein
VNRRPLPLLHAGRLAALVRDAQFWVPVAVLLFGLLVLWWIR